MVAFTVRPIEEADRAAVRTLIEERWGSDRQVSRGRVHVVVAEPGFLAMDEVATIVGVVTYEIEGTACEVTLLQSVVDGAGVGRALLEGVQEVAREAGCGRVWLVTTNDNLNALGFYQHVGYELVAIHRGAIAESRRLKPEIPLVGEGGLPLRDEIELELRLPR